MNDDQSFYEIQLNAPHIVLAFLGAAVVGVALFWLGVIIGRSQSATAAPSEWQTAGPVGAEQEEAGDDPAEFFEPAGASTAAAADDPAAGGTAPADSQPATEQEEATPPAQEETAADPPARTEDVRATEPVEEEPAPAVAPSRAGLPQADASLVTGWVIQVRSTPDEAAANRLQETLAGAGFPAFVISAQVDGTTYYRVRVGRYASRGDADLVEAALMERPDIEDAWVTEG